MLNSQDNSLPLASLVINDLLDEETVATKASGLRKAKIQ